MKTTSQRPNKRTRAEANGACTERLGLQPRRTTMHRHAMSPAQPRTTKRHATQKQKLRRQQPSSDATSKHVTPRIQLVEAFLHTGLFDTLTTFLDADALNALCVAMDSNSQSVQMLQDEAFWQRLLQKLMINSCLPATPTAKTEKLHATRSNGFQQPNLLISDTKLYQLHHACQRLTDFLNLYSQHSTFKTNVVVIKGDLGLLKEVDDQSVDCLAFPTSAGLRNPGVGAAGVVHARAGDQLDRHIAQQYMRATTRRAGDVVVTPAFGAGVDHLIHCIGPFGGIRDADELLYKVYVSALREIKKHDVKCAAFASVSTGLLRFPIDQAAQIAMSAVRDVMLRTRWEAKVVFVCLDPEVFKHFSMAKRALEHHFDTNWYQFPRVFTPTTMI